MNPPNNYKRKQAGKLRLNCGKTYKIYFGINTIGRNKDAVINIKDMKISHNHAIITVLNDGITYLSDLKSSNGTYLSHKLQPFVLYPISHNNLIKFGDVKATFLKHVDQENDTEIALEATQNFTQSFYYENTQNMQESQLGKSFNYTENIHEALTQVIEENSPIVKSRGDFQVANTEIVIGDNEDIEENEKNEKNGHFSKKSDSNQKIAEMSDKSRQSVNFNVEQGLKIDDKAKLLITDESSNDSVDLVPNSDTQTQIIVNESQKCVPSFLFSENKRKSAKNECIVPSSDDDTDIEEDLKEKREKNVKIQSDSTRNFSLSSESENIKPVLLNRDKNAFRILSSESEAQIDGIENPEMETELLNPAENSLKLNINSTKDIFDDSDIIPATPDDVFINSGSKIEATTSDVSFRLKLSNGNEKETSQAPFSENFNLQLSDSLQESAKLLLDKPNVKKFQFKRKNENSANSDSSKSSLVDQICLRNDEKDENEGKNQNEEKNNQKNEEIEENKENEEIKEKEEKSQNEENEEKNQNEEIEENEETKEIEEKNQNEEIEEKSQNGEIEEKEEKSQNEENEEKNQNEEIEEKSQNEEIEENEEKKSNEENEEDTCQIVSFNKSADDVFYLQPTQKLQKNEKNEDKNEERETEEQVSIMGNNANQTNNEEFDFLPTQKLNLNFNDSKAENRSEIVDWTILGTQLDPDEENIIGQDVYMEKMENLPASDDSTKLEKDRQIRNSENVVCIEENRSLDKIIGIESFKDNSEIIPDANLENIDNISSNLKNIHTIFTISDEPKIDIENQNSVRDKDLENRNKNKSLLVNDENKDILIEKSISEENPIKSININNNPDAESTKNQEKIEKSTNEENKIENQSFVSKNSDKNLIKEIENRIEIQKPIKCDMAPISVESQLELMFASPKSVPETVNFESGKERPKNPLVFVLDEDSEDFLERESQKINKLSTKNTEKFEMIKEKSEIAKKETGMEKEKSGMKKEETGIENEEFGIKKGEINYKKRLSDENLQIIDDCQVKKLKTDDNLTPKPNINRRTGKSGKFSKLIDKKTEKDYSNSNTRRSNRNKESNKILEENRAEKAIIDENLIENPDLNNKITENRSTEKESTIRNTRSRRNFILKTKDAENMEIDERIVSNRISNRRKLKVVAEESDIEDIPKEKVARKVGRPKRNIGDAKNNQKIGLTANTDEEIEEKTEKEVIEKMENRASTSKELHIETGDFKANSPVNRSMVFEKKSLRSKKNPAINFSHLKLSPSVVRRSFDIVPVDSRNNSVENSAPERSRRTLKPKVVFTMLKDAKLELYVRQMGGLLVDSIESGTVLVTGEVKRTPKLLAAVGFSKPICSPAWILQSYANKSFLDPWDFILTDPEAETKWSFSLKESLQKSSKSKLFKLYSFQLVVNKDAVEPLKGAIEACGGKVISRIPARYTPDKLLVVSTEETLNKCKKIRKDHPDVKIVEKEAVFDAVLRQEIRFERHYL